MCFSWVNELYDQIELKEPCSVNIQFDTNGQFYCGQCKKSVTDLTTKSNKEIQEIISAETYDYCATYLGTYNDGLLGQWQQSIAKLRQFMLPDSGISWKIVCIPIV